MGRIVISAHRVHFLEDLLSRGFRDGLGIGVALGLGVDFGFFALIGRFVGVDGAFLFGGCNIDRGRITLGITYD